MKNFHVTFENITLKGVLMDILQRKQDLEKICKSLDETAQKSTCELIDHIVFLEKQLAELKQLPFIEVNPKNPMQQRPTAAAKQYKELLQQYNGCIKLLLSAAQKNDGEDTSPLREYLKRIKEEKNGDN